MKKQNGNKKPKLRIKAKDAVMNVSRTVLQGFSSDESVRIKIRPFATDTANVGVKYGMTIPMGDYSSARVDVMINSPCYVEEIPQVFKQVAAMADELLAEEIKKIKGEKEEKDE